MASPLKVYNSGSAVQVMTDAEIDSMIVPLVLQEFASNQVYSVRGNCTAYANNDGNIGSFDNRYRGDDVGDHPISAGNFTTTTWSLYQEQSNAVSTANVIYPTKFISSGNKLQQMSFADLTATILARVSNNWRTNLYPVGGYYVGTAAPDADTWIYTGDAVTETYRQAGADSEIVYRLWRKTAPNTTSGDRPIYNRPGNDGVQEMTDADIKSLAAEWRNYLMNSSVGEDIGYYKLVVGTSTPTPGTWVQTGAYTDYLTDTGDVIYSQGYEGIYSQMYEGIYSGQYLGLYSGQFTGIYSGQFTGLFSRGYEGFYSQGYSGGYAGGYQGPYQGGYTTAYTVTYGSGSEAPNPQASSEGGSFSHTYSGVYSGIFSGTFSGQYSNQFAGFYSNQYTGVTVFTVLEQDDYSFWKRVA